MSGEFEAVDRLDSEAVIEQESLSPSGDLMTCSGDLMKQILKAKKDEPSKFQSYWEMDEEDVNDFTEQEINEVPEKRILWAAENGKIDLVKHMIEQQADLVSACDMDGYTPLHRACYSGHTEIAELLLRCGASVNARTADGWTPLHSACRWGEAYTTQLLLWYGADVNAQTNGQLTPVHLAASHDQEGSRNTLEILLTHRDINPDLTDARGETVRGAVERCSRHASLAALLEPAIRRLNEPQAQRANSS